MDGLKRAMKDQRGGVMVVEATLIFPIVLVVLTILIFFAAYQLQKANLHIHAQKIAVYSARSVAFPGYENIAQAPDNNADLGSGADISSGNITETMKIHDPYRYWSFNFPEDYLMEAYLKDLVDNYMLLSIHDPVCVVTYTVNPINQRFTARIEGKLRMPEAVGYLNIDRMLSLEVEATAVSMDQAEFIRNLDIAYDITEFIVTKYGIKEKVGGFLQRVKDTMAKLT